MLYVGIDVGHGGGFLREVVLDTETTGLKPEEGHRIIEIGCLELINHLPSGRKYHSYFNPNREIEAEATSIHGLTWKDLRGSPDFADQAASFLSFIAGDKLIIHNAEFDLGFINAELERLNLGLIASDRTVDTVLLARRKFPGSPANLDALCKRFSINNSKRGKHGALIDVDLLAQVYAELIGARQATLGFAAKSRDRAANARAPRVPRAPREHAASDEEVARHTAFLAKLRKPLWLSH